MKTIKFGRSTVAQSGSAYMIAEIGHNHQGSLETALKMIKTAVECGVNCVKFQKRDNKNLFTKAYYDRPYDNENSYGDTYGAHREALEFGEKEYRELMACCEKNNVEFMSTAFDVPSVDFLERLKVTSYKTASADITNTPLLKYIAKTGKPMFISTGAATIDEIKIAYDAIHPINDKIILLHCTAGYPTDYKDLNLAAIKTFQKLFPDAIIGYSGHDNGILACIAAYMLGATVMEKHFTMNHAWKGTDHKFSLEPEGMRKQVRDLHRIDQAMGDGSKSVRDFESDARAKMGKSLYTVKAMSAGTVLTEKDICIKTPGGGLPPYELDTIVNRRLKVDVKEETKLTLDILK
ncbi:MAG: N-acetylneuraminate synthase family protein [Fibrobacterota bacterium]